MSARTSKKSRGAGTSPEREHLVGREIVGMQDGTDAEADQAAEPAAVSEDLDRALLAAGGVHDDDR
jgi:hypothetical protein